MFCKSVYAGSFLADLCGADLTGAWLDAGRLTRALYDDFAHWPADFDPEEEGSDERDTW